MNFPMLTPTPENDPVEQIYGVLSDLNAKDKWSLAVTMLAGVLKLQDELSQRRLLAGLQSELRAACAGIKQIQETGVSPNAPERLQ